MLRATGGQSRFRIVQVLNQSQGAKARGIQGYVFEKFAKIEFREKSSSAIRFTPNTPLYFRKLRRSFKIVYWEYHESARVGVLVLVQRTRGKSPSLSDFSVQLLQRLPAELILRFTLRAIVRQQVIHLISMKKRL